MTYRYNINKPVTTIQISNIINEVKGQESVKLYNEFYNYMDFNISKDIERIEREHIEYLLEIFIDMKSNIQEKNMTNYEKILFSKMNKVNESILKKYIEKNKNFFDRILKHQYDIGFEYEYYQSKLDWYTITPERINNFIKGLVNTSENLSGIMGWTEDQTGRVKYRDFNGSSLICLKNLSAAGLNNISYIIKYPSKTSYKLTAGFSPVAIVSGSISSFLRL